MAYYALPMNEENWKSAFMNVQARIQRSEKRAGGILGHTI